MGCAIQTLHSGFTVADVRHLARFFRECLGFETTEPHAPPSDMLSRIIGVPGAEALIVYVTAPGHTIELLEYRLPPTITRAAPRPCDVGFAHLAFLVDDVQRVAAAASAHGFAVLSDIPRIETGRSAGRRATYLRDPQGFTVELMGG
jgi:catechol 2,3-dioxygenase-like lactoylglutathione lyase family enzyme